MANLKVVLLMLLSIVSWFGSRCWTEATMDEKYRSEVELAQLNGNLFWLDVARGAEAAQKIFASDGQIKVSGQKKLSIHQIIMSSYQYPYPFALVLIHRYYSQQSFVIIRKSGRGLNQWESVINVEELTKEYDIDAAKHFKPFDVKEIKHFFFPGLNVLTSPTLRWALQSQQKPWFVAVLSQPAIKRCRESSTFFAFDFVTPQGAVHVGADGNGAWRDPNFTWHHLSLHQQLLKDALLDSQKSRSFRITQSA